MKPMLVSDLAERCRRLKPIQPSTYNSWQKAIRPIEDIAVNAVTHATTLDYRMQQLKPWGPLGEGAYARAAPLAMTKVTRCPVPEDFCVESVSSIVTLRAPFFGCSHESAFAWRCAFSGGFSSPAQFTFDDGPDGPATITCEAPPVDGSYSIELRYASPQGDDDNGTGDGGAATSNSSERRLVFSTEVSTTAQACDWCGRSECDNACDVNNAFIVTNLRRDLLCISVRGQQRELLQYINNGLPRPMFRRRLRGVLR